MIPKEECMDIWVLSRQGYSQRQIAKRLGISRVTVKKYLESRELPGYRKIARKSQIDPYRQLVQGWLGQDDYLATKIHEMLIGQGYQGAYDSVQRYVKTLKEERDRVAYIRFETVPGQQAQVDFGEFAVVHPTGEEQKLYCFVMVLGYSRHMYVEFVERCTMPVFLDCHIRAFEYFGGVPGEILYDNMKNVVVRRFVGKVRFNDTMLDFGAHYQYKPLACPAYSPWCKGKVERPMDYIRERFWRGYVYYSREQANDDILKWLNTVAFQRQHGTTKEKVCDRFTGERNSLGNIPLRPYDTAEKYIRKVEKDCRLSFDGNQYVIPHRCVGRKVLVKVKHGIVRVYRDEELVITYDRGQGKGEVIFHPWVYEALKRDQEQWRMKYRKPFGKGKATIGLRKYDNYAVDVQVRDIAVYENLFLGGGLCQN